MHKQALHHAINTAKQVADDVIMPGWSTQNFTVECKPDQGNSPVTEIDREAEAFIRESLLTAFPDHGFLGEESRDNPARLDKKYVWIVDPIDGTRSFIKKGNRFTISIGLVERQKDGTYIPVVGVVYAPVQNRLFSAARGMGLSLDEKPIGRNTSPKPLSEQLAMISLTEQKKGLLDGFDGHFKMDNNPSFAHKLALVAVGEADFMFTLKPKSEWDMVAGHLMCEEAGIVVTDLDNNPITYNLEKTTRPHLIAALPETHEAFLATLGKELCTEDAESSSPA